MVLYSLYSFTFFDDLSSLMPLKIIYRPMTSKVTSTVNTVFLNFGLTCPAHSLMFPSGFPIDPPNSTFFKTTAPISTFLTLDHITAFLITADETPSVHHHNCVSSQLMKLKSRTLGSSLISLFHFPYLSHQEIILASELYRI